MATLYNPKIVTDGLVLCLDAANPRSYPRSGTTWRDVSGRGTDFTISSGGAFSAANGGEIVFDGTTAGISNTTSITSNTACTVQIWLRINNDATGILFGGPNFNNTYYGAYTTGTTFYESISTSNSYLINAESYTGIPANTLINNRYFLFETRNMNLSGRTAPANDWSNYVIAANIIGGLSMVLLYNRNLTANESLQNYNAMRSRFGV